MITRINRIKGLGFVFSEFKWDSQTPDFKQINLIYGWNGCGKTTLTRLFDHLGSHALSGLEYELEIGDGTKFDQFNQLPIQIRVFNQDYVAKNVHILESSANAISILLGEKNKDLLTQIQKDERELNGDPDNPDHIGKLRELDGYTKKKQRKEKDNETAFSDIARTIGAAIAGSSAASRTYRNPDARKDFAALGSPQLLNEEQLQASNLTLKQQMLQELSPIEPGVFHYAGRPREIFDLTTALLGEAQDLCRDTAHAELMARLIEHQDIARWVEQGLTIHAVNHSDRCEYCGNPLSPERLNQLTAHFSDADRKLKQKIDALLLDFDRVVEIFQRLIPHDPARLYQELQAEYEKRAQKVIVARGRVIDEIAAVRDELRAKKERTSSPATLTRSIDSEGLRQPLASLNEILDAHNKKSSAFRSTQEAAIKAVKRHYLSSIYDDVARREREITELGPDLDRRSREIAEIQGRITSAKAKISSTHKACDQINAALCTFLGRNELRFAPEGEILPGDEAKNGLTPGYRILHGDEPARYLSEGEKSAIAFVYFMVHLNDGQFSKGNGIVVIDDPVSSLDSNSLYQAFSFLKNAVRDCRQVFVLTHNFEFLKLLLNWRERRGKTGYFMIRNVVVGDERRATIAEMDKELREYASEYHYLFKRLKEMRQEQDGTIMRAYPVPNVARKVWDSFLLYRVPNGRSPYSQMEELKKEGIDPIKLDAIYKFTNSQSHITGGGFDPALVPETKKVLDELFELMERIAPDHFRVLDAATQA